VPERAAEHKKRPAKTEEQQPAQQIACKDCGKVYDLERERLRTIQGYQRTAEGVICRNRPECRGRQLSAEYDRRGLKKWSRRTQEQLLAIMDCPPKNWDKSKKWESVQEAHERVGAAVEFFSTCWPVCLLYAVQTDEEGEPIKEMGEWKYHTTR